MIESAGVLDSIIRSASDAIVVADAAGRIAGWNPAAERMFGYSESEVLGESLTIIVPPEFHDAHRKGIERVVATGETRIIGKTVEVTAVRKDGSIFPIELSLSTWLTGEGRFFTGIVRDISERKRLVDALTESQARVTAILESANDAIISLDHSGRVVQWNSTAERMFGHAASDILGSQLDVIIPPQFREAHHAGIKRVVTGGPQHVIGSTVELSAVHADGREFPIELSLARWESADGPAFTGIVRDISQRKQAEEDLRRANESLAEKNDMLEGLSTKLAKYLSRQVYDSIFEGRTEVRVQSYRKKLTVFFSDIQGFTELTDRIEAETVSELLNRYLSEMSAVALVYGGTIDKFIGDGIMIFFGDPESHGEAQDALACVRMAIAMRDKVAELKREWQRQTGAVELNVRMGINTGYCTVGNFGSQDRLDYTIVGKEVNLASRLESTAQPNQIHISHSTYELIRDHVYCRPVGEFRVKGLAYPVRTYEVAPLTASVEGVLLAKAMEGFRLELDLASLPPEDAREAEATLRAALDALQRTTGGTPLPPT